jgi:two-component system, sensor histidine kinase and response regulator
MGKMLKENNLGVTTLEIDDIDDSIKQQKTQLERLKTDNNRLLSIIGHDLKNPIAQIISFLSLLQENMSYYDRDKNLKFIEVALISARKSYALLENLLDWELNDNLKKSFRGSNFDLSSLLKEELENLSLMASTKQINFCFKSKSKLIISADIDMIRTVVRNLLTNAIKYSSLKGKIRVEASDEDKYVLVSIQDYGVGITAKIKDQIFNSCKHDSTLGTNSESGSGFGLLLCKDFIDIHGGNIWLTSKYGKGSVFFFTLPK